ncbi:MAG: fumarylacetoacetate hydrolase family protein [Ginsengibacter sp.]
MKLYKVTNGIIINHDNRFYTLREDWDALINRNFLHDYLKTLITKTDELSVKKAHTLLEDKIMPPIGKQETWAAGVTYLRSRDARMDESQKSGGASLYDRVYDAERPELFFKSLPHRVAGHKDSVYIRRDSIWNVPEPELTLFINSEGKIQAYTIGNDMSSRSIEGDNALYLPQAKIYERSAAIGPCLYIPKDPISITTVIQMTIRRNGKVFYDDSTSIDKMKRQFDDLASYLYRECDFNYGCYLMTGTCLVPPGGFTLQEEDIIEISIDSIGTLLNKVKFNPLKLTSLKTLA